MIQRFGQGKSADQMALPLDRALAPELPQRHEVVEGGTPPRRSPAGPRLDHARRRRRGPGPDERSVSARVRREDRARRRRRAAAGGLCRLESRRCSVHPRVATDPSRTSDRHDDPLAPKPSDQPRKGSSSIERGRPDQHARRAGRERGLDRILAAVAAPDLNGHACVSVDDARGQAGAEVRRRTRRRGRRGGATARPPRQSAVPRHRVAALDCHRLPPPLREPHAAALEDVDRRRD